MIDADDIASPKPLSDEERIIVSWQNYKASGNCNEFTISANNTNEINCLPRLKPEMVDVEPLRLAIRKCKMMAIWGDSISELTSTERTARARSRALEVKQSFIALMTSSSNDRSYDYLEWAIKTALELRTSKRHTAQAIGGKHWRSWGPK